MIFGEGLVYQGMIIEIKDKVGIVVFFYGVEGICFFKYLCKEDGFNVKVEEIFDFKVIEFNKDVKKIVVFYICIFEEGEDECLFKGGSKKGGNIGGGSFIVQVVKVINQGNEKLIFGDFDVFVVLKEKMEGKE